MTRFARSKGSKSSNERICEKATSWQEMKEQLLEKKKEIEDEENRKKVEQMRNSNYQNFLKDREEHAANQSEWSEFPNASENKNNKTIKQAQGEASQNKKRKITTGTDNEIDSGIEGQCNTIEEITITRKKIKKSLDEHGNSRIDDDAPLEISSKVEVKEPKVKKCKRKKKKLSIVLEDHKKIDKGVESKIEENTKEGEKNTTKNHNEQMRKVINMDSLTEDEKKKLQKKLERRKRQVEKKKIKKQQARENLDKIEENGKVISTGEKEGKFKHKLKELPNKKENGKSILKKEKLKSGDFKRRKSFQPNTMMINGKEVDISYFDGFPIKKGDAENLKNLKKAMISKGLPRSEIDRTLKLERRKAEKALTREKKNVCFNCRKFGHNLSECPELSNKESGELVDSNGTGICFKCGSTEHTSFACRVVHGPNFKFATCFICKEQGHISRQCPDNARGLYPKGGSCKVCGDVTHLKKDCPKFRGIQEREEEKYQLNTINRGNPEDIDEGIAKTLESNSIKPNKVIKF